MSRAWRGRLWALARGALLLVLQAGSTRRSAHLSDSLINVDVVIIPDSSWFDGNADCAIVAAAIDSLYANRDVRFLVLRDTTFAERILGEPRNDVAADSLDSRRITIELEKSFGLEANTIQHFLARNAVPRPVCSAPPSRKPVWILHPSLRTGARDSRRPRIRAPSGLDYPGVITVSRAGMSVDGRQALLTVSNICGGLCGSGWLVVLHRGDGGRWRVMHAQMLWIS